jgi:molybdopterin converting factor subunit 1
MIVKVMLFAAARELAGHEVIAAKLMSDHTVAALRKRLSDNFPALAPLLAKSAIAVNQDFAEDSHVLSDSDEVAIIPPVSGG